MNIKEIAQLAGVSSATVSRYLNRGYVSAEKSERICAVIEETGYRPSAQAQLLRTKKSKLIGVVVPKLNSEAVARIAAGVGKVLDKNGYLMLLADTENNISKEREYLNLLQNNPVDGIIFSATILTKAHEDFIKQAQVPIVVVSQKTDLTACVYHDDYNAARELTEKMIRRGRKHIAYIGVTQKDKAAGRRRHDGFAAALKAAGLPHPEEGMYFEVPFSLQAGYDSVKAMQDSHQVFDGLFCATDSIAIGAMDALREAGKRIPEDVSIVGIGHNQMSQVVTPPLTTVHLHYKTSGCEAAETLMDILKKQETVMKQVKLGYKIIEGGTV